MHSHNMILYLRLQLNTKYIQYTHLLLLIEDLWDLRMGLVWLLSNQPELSLDRHKKHTFSVLESNLICTVFIYFRLSFWENLNLLSEDHVLKISSWNWFIWCSFQTYFIVFFIKHDSSCCNLNRIFLWWWLAAGSVSIQFTICAA